MYKEELKQVYYLAFSCFIMLIVTYITDDIGIGIGIALPLFLILIIFGKIIKNFFQKR